MLLGDNMTIVGSRKVSSVKIVEKEKNICIDIQYIEKEKTFVDYKINSIFKRNKVKKELSSLVEAMNFYKM